PYDMFAVPLREVVRMQSTSGTTGEALIVGYTKNDIEHWTELTARVLTAAGIVKDDIIQITFPYGLFTGGLGFHFGAERIGASVIPSAEADIAKQIVIMKDYRTTAFCGSPSFAALLIEMLEEKGLTPDRLSLSKASLGAEPWSERFRREIERKLAISATDNYGLTEIMGPGVSYECENKNGLHFSEDHFIPEIIDPETEKVLPPGEKGELVITTITKEAYPLIRYRTGDLTSLITGECPCGRTFVRMAKVLERTDDMIILNGRNMFPSQFEHILTDIIGIAPRYRLVIDRVEKTDELIIQVEVSNDFFSDEIKTLNVLEFSIIREIKEKLDFVPKVKFVEPGTIGRKMKKRKVVDNRKK
ncbi:MAG: phenylacetate--CoA ligase, partial [Spirochaetes bacterium]|nr:phenylacetate--CoA ligase [Spirochaetota bacterium]